MSTRGYSSYHGRRGGRRIAMVMALLTVFMLSVGYLVLQNFIVYESDGSVRLDLPFFEKDTTEDGEDELVEAPPVEILPGEDELKEPAIAAPEIRGQSISAAALCRDPGSWFLAAAERGETGVLVPVKGDNGIFYYTSPLAKTKASDAAAVSQTLLQSALDQTQMHKIAQLSCFHDSFFAFSDMAGAGICQQSGYIWYDNRSSYWLDPSKSAAREYLCAVAAECAAMGFDELLLTEFTYPTEGKLSNIDYSAMTMSKADALELFLTQLRGTVGENVALSVVLPENVILAGRDEVSGLDVARLVPLVDRIYVNATDRQAVLTALNGAGAAYPEAITVWLDNGNVISAFAKTE